jgi:hypothetical protein
MKLRYEMVPTKNETFHNRVWHYTQSSAGTCLFIIIKMVTTSRMDGCIWMMLDDTPHMALSYLALSSTKYALTKKNIETCEMMINVV